MADLTERLREVDRYAPHDGLPSILDLVAKDCTEAANEIDALRSRTAALETELADIKQYRPTLSRVSELESALAKSASQEAELLEKLKVAEGALGGLRRVVPYFWNDDSSHISELEEACEKADTALAKIKEAS